MYRELTTYEAYALEAHGRHHGGIILAPSASGKSYWAGLGRWIDGDLIIANTIGWPRTLDWWMQPNASSVHNRNATILSAFANEGNLIAFNGGWTLVAGVIRPLMCIRTPGALLAFNAPTHPHLLKHKPLLRALTRDLVSNHEAMESMARRLDVPILSGDAATYFLERQEPA